MQSAFELESRYPTQCKAVKQANQFIAIESWLEAAVTWKTWVSEHSCKHV